MAIREKLDVHPGDSLACEIDGDTVVIRKAQPFELVWHRDISTTLNEWDSPHDHTVA